MPESIIVREGVQTSSIVLETPEPVAQRFTPPIPAYLVDHYGWVYLHPASIMVFDHSPVVSAILWGQYGRLKQAVFAEILPGGRVLQAACVYGDLTPGLARLVGAGGHLDVVDIVHLQVANCQRKLKGFPHAVARLADAAVPGGAPYDVVLCFFLLHELPDDRKRAVVDGLLECVAPGGKVVFIDYHKPHPLHPLKPVMNLVFKLLKPFAKRLWQTDISDFARDACQFHWRKQTFFSGLFQKVVAVRLR